MPFRFFFFYPVPLLYFFVSVPQHEKEIKNKLSTDSPCFGPLSVGWSKEIIRELVKIVHTSIAEDDHENFGEARAAGRASRVSASLWWDGRRQRTIAACSTFPKWVQGKNRKNTVVATQKGRRSSEKVDTRPQGKTFAGLLCNRARAKRKLTKIKKIKRTKERSRKKGTELDPSGKRVPNRKHLP